MPSDTMTPMGGKRAGSRRGPRTKRQFSPALLGLSLGVTALVVAWGYLVVAAIDFGTEARSGRSEAWWFLALASVGAVACLFAGLMLVTRILQLLTSGASSASGTSSASAAAVPRSEGGRRVR